MANEVITVALVFFINGKENLVPVTCVENFFPKNRKDFTLNRRYKVWWRGDQESDDCLYNAYILLLGSK